MSIGKHTSNPGFKSGRHWNTCQRCGLDYYDNETREEWTGLIVCKECYEPRHPQDFVKGQEDDFGAKGLVTGKLVDSFISVTYADTDQDDIPSGTYTQSNP